MKVVLTAILAKYNVSPTLKAQLESFSLGEAPERSDYPYVVFFPVLNVASYAMSVDPYTTMMIQFSIFDKSESALDALSIFDTLKAVYGGNDKTLLLSDGWTCIYLRLVDSNLVRDDDVWHMFATYVVEVDTVSPTTTTTTTTSTTSTTTTTTSTTSTTTTTTSTTSTTTTTTSTTSTTTTTTSTTTTTAGP